MKSPVYLFGRLLLAMAAPLSMAAAQDATPATATVLAQDAQLHTGKLANGMSYIIRHTQEPAGRASARLYVNVGSLHETEENSGISHFLEHMVFNGSRSFKRGELIPTMQKLGLGFGGDANAYTSLLQTVYMLDLPNLDEKTVNFALTIMRDFADGATLEADAIDHERGIVVSELKSRDSASYRTMIGVLAQLTDGTRVAQFMPIGREEVIRHAPYSVVRDYYKNHYVPERMTLILTGDFKPEEAEGWVKKHFDSMQPRQATPAPPMGELKQDGPREKLIPNPESANCTLMANVVRPYVYKADTVEQRIADYPLELAIAMLNRRLSRLTKQEDCPFIGAQVEQTSIFRAVESAGVSLVCTPANWQSALELVMQQVRQALAYGFTQQEIKEASEGLLSNLKQACDTWETTTAQKMATLLVKALSDQIAMTAPQENLRVARMAAEKLQSDPDAFRRALAEAFAPEQARLTLTGSLPEGVDEAALRAAYDQTLKAEVPKPEEKKALTFAYETIGMPGAIAQREELRDLGITCLTLSNGVKVNLKPIDFRKGSIAVSAAVDGGELSLPTLTPGLVSMANAVMRTGGLQEHSMDDLESLFMGKQVLLDFAMTDTRLVFRGRTNAEDLEQQCKLLAAAILHPGFRPEGELLLRRSLEGRYKQLASTTEGAYAMQLPRALFGEDPRFVIPTQQEMEARSTAEVREALAPMLRDGALEVSIVGDFKVEEVLPILERTFGAMPQRKAEFAAVPAERRTVQFRPWGQREYLRYTTELDKTIVAQVRPAGNGRDERRMRRMAVLASIVREKLFDGLRAAMGESYSPRVQLRANKEQENAAYITTISAGVKGNRAKVNAAMESICNGIGQGQISQEDFDCAIRPYIAQAQKALITPDFWEDALLQLQSDPRRLELMRNLLDDVKSISLEEIRELGKEVFGKDNANFYFVVPEDYDETATPTEGSATTPPQADLTSLNAPAPGEYAVVITQDTFNKPEWKAVAETLLRKYEKASLAVVADCSAEALRTELRRSRPRYVAFVLRPEEISRELVNTIHRTSRMLDDDPYGDCIWGIVSGYTAADAQRIAEAKAPLIIRRLLGTTNVNAARFEHSCCITDWEGFPILEQSGYTEPVKTTFSMDTPEGQDIIENGVQGKFAAQLATQRPELIVTSSHATQFNLEMPFSKGLIFSANNRFYQLGCKQLSSFPSALQPAKEGQTEALQCLADAMQLPSIEPDGTPRVWLACGNCLLGNALQTNQSMVITALSAYTCNQFVGYTVPSWYGAAGWGTLELFMGNTDNTTLAEAFFLNNQFILHQTLSLDPALLKVEFNEAELGPALQRDILAAGIHLQSKHAKDAIGLIHDRDTLAFYGDPGWAALVDHSHAHAPLRISWQGSRRCTLTANTDYTGRAAIWFPSAEMGRQAAGCDLKGAVFTNDFILIPAISLKAGESITINLLPALQEAA